MPMLFRLLLYDSGGRRVSTYGPNDSLEQLKGFWDSIWYRYSNVALDFALQQWQREGRRSQLDSFNINAQDLWMSARKSSGSSAGPDGWTGNEVAAWPLRAWQVYAKLLARWQARRQWPEAWKHVRQVHLPKMSAEDGGAVHFSNMRPICVQSILWRVVASSITRHANVTRWLQQVLPPEAHGGPVFLAVALTQRSLLWKRHSKREVPFWWLWTAVSALTWWLLVWL